MLTFTFTKHIPKVGSPPLGWQSLESVPEKKTSFSNVLLISNLPEQRGIQQVLPLLR